MDPRTPRFFPASGMGLADLSLVPGAMFLLNVRFGGASLYSPSPTVPVPFVLTTSRVAFHVRQVDCSVTQFPDFGRQH